MNTQLFTSAGNKLAGSPALRWGVFLTALVFGVICGLWAITTPFEHDVAIMHLSAWIGRWLAIPILVGLISAFLTWKRANFLMGFVVTLLILVAFQWILAIVLTQP